MDFRVVRNDITKMDIDAIVCPSNSKLKEGSGTSAAIFGAAGRDKLARACADKLRNSSSSGLPKRRKPSFRREGKVPVGRSIVTSAYALPARIIIHTVVPRWHGGAHNEYEKLSEAYISALVVADRTSCASLALPLLASGNMGFNLDVAIEVAVKSIEAYKPTNKLSDVVIVTYGSNATQKMRDLGYTVEELIDERYVQENDESYKPAVAYAAMKAKDAAEDFIDRAIEMADDLIHDDEIAALVKKVAIGVISDYVGEKFPAIGAQLKKGPIGKKK